MDPSLIGQLAIDPSPPALTPERRDQAMKYAGLACRCGSQRFHLAGWPRVVSGRGGFFWRTVARVWREARLAMEDGEPAESPFWLPVSVSCDRCGVDQILFDGESVLGRMPEGRRGEPRESYRCRVCRRGSVELVVGEAGGSEPGSVAFFEVVTRCVRCRREARVAWSEGRPTEQEVRLDRLYGRR